MAQASHLVHHQISALEVVVTLCLTYTLCIFFLRLWMRRRLYGVDDLIALVATVLSIAQFATQYVALSNGLGRPSPYLATSPSLGTLNNVSLAGVILFLLTLYMSKCGAIALAARFAQPGRHMIEVYAVLAVTILLGTISVLELTIGCGVTSTYYWDIAANSGHCSNQYTRWQLATAFDVITEILILAIPIDFIWGLRMATSKKIVVLIAFLVRFPVLALSIARNYYVHTLLSTSDPGLASGKVIIFQEVELTFSLAAATLMTLRPFTRDFNTGFGLGGDIVANYGASGYTVSNANSRFNNSGGGESKNIFHSTEMRTRRSSRPGFKDRTSSGRLGSFAGPVIGDAEGMPSVREALKQGFSMRSLNLGRVTEGQDHALEPKDSQEAILQEKDTESLKIYKHITFCVETEPVPEDDLATANTPYPGSRYGHPVTTA